MDPATMAAIIGTGAQVGQGIVGAFNAKRDRRWQAEDYERIMQDDRANWDRDRNAALSDWNMQNAYNDPSAVMERLKKAGLNPALIYGSAQGAMGQAGDVSSNSGPGAPSTERPRSSDYGLDNIPGAAANIAQLAIEQEQQRMNKQQLEAQQQLINAQTLKALTDVDSKKLDTQLKRDTYNDMVRRAGLLNESTATDIDLKKQQKQESQQRIEESKERIRKIGVDIRYTYNENQRQNIKMQVQNAKTEQEKKLIMEKILTEAIERENKRLQNQTSESTRREIEQRIKNLQQTQEMLEQQNNTYYLDKFLDIF